MKNTIFSASLALGFTCSNLAYADLISNDSHLDKVVVTSTQESKSISELAESVGVFEREDIESVSPSHPSDVLNRTAGVYVNNLGGEGHMTAIRQPITTGGVYLFLEDGVPTRPTGFFNHNGLYEVNIPQSERLEITKGPGSALYGSDAIGGVINSISAKVPDTSQSSLDAEIGQNNWQRLLISAGTPIANYSGISLSANITQNDSFRDDARYERASLNSRYQYRISSTFDIGTSLSYTHVDQSGVSSLELDDYRNSINKNEFKGDVGARDVEALRVTSVMRIRPHDNSLITVTPFYRNNLSNMMPSWMVTYDPNVRETEFQSFGLLSKWRYDANENLQFITGVDVDHTPSKYTEYQVSVAQDGEFYTDFEKTGVINYDFDADQTSISPYLHVEHKLADNLRAQLGVRYDHFKVDYANGLQTGGNPRLQRPDSQTIEYDHLSPKAGLVVNLSDYYDLYLNYRHGFRAPSVSSLFRAGSNSETTNLRPVKTDSIELGTRGLVFGQTAYELAIYYMKKTDDIVTVINSDNNRESVNTGETLHQGIELGLSSSISADWDLSSSFSYSQQEYGDFSYTYFCFSCSPQNQVVNFDGNDIGKAPKTLGNISLRYEPQDNHRLMLELELEHVGEYFTDETNTQKYDGHDLVNLRGQYRLDHDVTIYGRLQNLLDERYSTYTSNQVGSNEIAYRPGAPLTLFVGLRARF